MLYHLVYICILSILYNSYSVCRGSARKKCVCIHYIHTCIYTLFTCSLHTHYTCICILYVYYRLYSDIYYLVCIYVLYTLYSMCRDIYYIYPIEYMLIMPTTCMHIM